MKQILFICFSENYLINLSRIKFLFHQANQNILHILDLNY